MFMTRYYPQSNEANDNHLNYYVITDSNCCAFHQSTHCHVAVRSKAHEERGGAQSSAQISLTNGIIHFNMQTLAACGQPNYGVCSLRIRIATLQRNKEKTGGQSAMTSGTKLWTSAVRKARGWLCGLVTWPLCWSYSSNTLCQNITICVAGGTVWVGVCARVCACASVQANVCMYVCVCMCTCTDMVCMCVRMCALMHA